MLPVQRKQYAASREGGLFALMHLLRVSELAHLFRPSSRPLSPSLFLSPFACLCPFPYACLSVCLSGLTFSVLLSPMHSLISLIFSTQGSPVPQGLCYSHLCPSLSSVCGIFFACYSSSSITASYHFLHSVLCLRSLCQESGAGGCFECVFASSQATCLWHLSCALFFPLLLLPSNPLPPHSSCDWAVLVRIGTIHAGLFRQNRMSGLLFVCSSI